MQSFPYGKRREVAKAITDVICKVTGNGPGSVRIVFTNVESNQLASDREKEVEYRERGRRG